VNSRVVIYLFTSIHRLRRLQPRLFLRQKYSFQTYMVSKTGARKWSRFLAPISGTCVMCITVDCGVCCNHLKSKTFVCRHTQYFVVQHIASLNSLALIF